MPKATSDARTGWPRARLRREVGSRGIIDDTGRVTLRHAGKLHHIAIGRTTPELASCSFPRQPPGAVVGDEPAVSVVGGCRLM